MTAMWPASGLLASRSKPLWVALSQVGYFFVSADGLYVLGSNQAAARAMPRLLIAIEAASRAAMGHLAAPGARAHLHFCPGWGWWVLLGHQRQCKVTPGAALGVGSLCWVA